MQPQLGYSEESSHVPEYHTGRRFSQQEVQTGI
jgi:hypothetical protein